MAAGVRAPRRAGPSLLLTGGGFAEFYEGPEGVVHGSGNAEFGAAAGDEAVEGIDFGGTAALYILRGGRRGRAERGGEFDAHGNEVCVRHADTGCASDGADFFRGCGHHAPDRLEASSESVAGAAEGGDGVARAVPDQLDPQFAVDIVAYAAGDARAREELRDAIDCGQQRRIRARADDEIAAAVVFQMTGSGHRGGNVNDGRQYHRERRAAGRAEGVANDGGVFDAILEADDNGVLAEVRGEGCGGSGGIESFDADEDDFGCGDSGSVGGRIDAQLLLKFQAFKIESVAGERGDAGQRAGAADERDGTFRADEFAAEEAADGAGADDGDTGPGGWGSVLVHVS